MKKLSCLCLVIFLCLNITYSQQKSNLSIDNKLSVSPINEDYYEYYLKSKTGRNKDINLGYIPSPVEPIFQKNDGLNKTVTFDAVYDLRTENLVTSVKNQNPYGTCWSFATYGAIESNWLKNGLGTYDLSENHLVINHGFELGYNDGGNAKMSIAYLSRLNGPVRESDDPYDPENGSTNSTNYVKYVTDARFISNDASTVKQAILDYGAIQTNMYWDATYYSSSDYTYYYAGSETTTNHGVLLVGWDDNKVVTGNGTNTPNNPGAWIIRNSWGTSWGESGYFYISYEDPNINTSLTYYPEQQTINDKIVMMYYDKLGWTNSLGYGTTSAYALVKYTVSTAHELMKVGTFVTGDNTTVKIDIFSDFELTNQLADLTQTVCASPGYYTFDVNSGVSLTEGSDVYIRVYYNTPGTSYPVPVEGTISNYSNPTIESNKCWLGSNGSSWSQIGSGTGLLYDLCIKTFGSTDGSLPVCLADIHSNYSNGNVHLNWITASEMNNRGFIIEREYNNEWIEIASYRNTRSLIGQGNTSTETHYEFIDEMVNSGSEFKYRISDISSDGEITRHDDFIQTVKIPITENIVCNSFKVDDLYPNPFNPSTIISYQLNDPSIVKITVYDINGKFIEQLFNQKQTIGRHTLRWQPENISGGIYFIQISSKNISLVKKCLYIK